MIRIDVSQVDSLAGDATFGRLWVMLRDDIARRHGRARRMARQDRAGYDLLAWGRRYLPEYFRRAPSDMHRWLADQIDQAYRSRGTKVNVLGPRGGAKSTIGTLCLPLHAAVERLESYIWIVSDTKHQACAHLENLKTELLENRRLARDYPEAVGRGTAWRGHSITLRNGVTIEAFGTGQRIRGRRRREHRPTLIVCDDLQNDGHMHSVVQRDHSREWFHGTLMKAGTGRTNVIHLATALHRAALAMELHRTPGWTSHVFRSIVRWPDNTALWQQWEAIYTDLSRLRYRAAARAFYEEHRQAMDAGAIVLWPEEEDLYALMCMRSESGRTAFEREKQNSPLNPDLCEWPESYFDATIWFDAWPEGLVVRTMALDPSKGNDARRSDYSALVMLGMDRQGFLYVEADLARRPTPQMVADGTEWFLRYRPDVFGVEANQFQELLAGEFEAAFRREGQVAARPVAIANHTSKQVRIRRLGPYLSSRRMRFKTNSPGTRLLVEQLQEFPIGDHDDGPDALEMAIRLAAEVLHGRAVQDGLGSRLPVGV
jgi:predicted phage terminase large subunit-like protein